MRPSVHSCDNDRAPPHRALARQVGVADRRCRAHRAVLDRGQSTQQRARRAGPHDRLGGLGAWRSRGPHQSRSEPQHGRLAPARGSRHGRPTRPRLLGIQTGSSSGLPEHRAALHDDARAADLVVQLSAVGAVAPRSGVLRPERGRVRVPRTVAQRSGADRALGRIARRPATAAVCAGCRRAARRDADRVVHIRFRQPERSGDRRWVGALDGAAGGPIAPRDTADGRRLDGGAAPPPRWPRVGHHDRAGVCAAHDDPSARSVAQARAVGAVDRRRRRTTAARHADPEP